MFRKRDGSGLCYVGVLCRLLIIIVHITGLDPARFFSFVFHVYNSSCPVIEYREVFIQHSVVVVDP